jgi:hypothetical protein
MTDSAEIRSIISKSGNNFHCRVVNYLREKGWHTLVSPYYMDAISNKPREIDLVAEKAFSCKREYRTINIKLFIECKYIPQDVVFWLDDKDMKATREWVISNTSLPENNTYTERHHYLQNLKYVAKLFSSKNKPNLENEVIYKALNQSLNAMVYHRRRGSIIPEDKLNSERILEAVEYPVILCNSFSKFYAVKMIDQSKPAQIDKNFQLEVNYAYPDMNSNHRNEFFLIDVVSFECLDAFLTVLEADVAAISGSCQVE